MSLTNLRTGSALIDPNNSNFPGSAGAPANVVVNGLALGTTGTMMFTLSGIDTARTSASISPDRSTVNISAVVGTGSTSWLVDDSINVKTSPNGTAVMKVGLNSGGPYTYSKKTVSFDAVAAAKKEMA